MVYYTLYHVTIDDRCMTSYTPCMLGFNCHMHPGGFLDPPTHPIEELLLSHITSTLLKISMKRYPTQVKPSLGNCGYTFTYKVGW